MEIMIDGIPVRFARDGWNVWAAVPVTGDHPYHDDAWLYVPCNHVADAHLEHDAPGCGGSWGYNGPRTTGNAFAVAKQAWSEIDNVSRFEHDYARYYSIIQSLPEMRTGATQYSDGYVVVDYYHDNVGRMREAYLTFPHPELTP